MASRWPVPSRNAIRVLRALAFPTPSTAILSRCTCSPCMSSCDYRSNVRVTEKLGRQRRSRHSTSRNQHHGHALNTTGNSRITENYGLARKKSPRESQVKRQSTSYDRQDASNRETLLSLDSGQDFPPPGLETFIPQRNTAVDKLSRHRLQDHMNIDQPIRSQSLNSFQNPERPLLLDPGISFYRPLNPSSNELKHLPQRSRDASAGIIPHTSQSATDLSELKRNPRRKLQESVENSAAKDFHSNTSLIEFDTWLDKDGIFDMKKLSREIFAMDESKINVAPLPSKHEGKEDFGSNALAMLPYLVSGTVPEKLYPGQKPPAEDAQIQNTDVLQEDVTNRYEFFCCFLRDEIDKLGISKGMKLCESTIELCVSTQGQEDLLIGLLLYITFSSSYPQHSWSTFAYRLVQKQLDREQPFQACFVFLYPRWKIGAVRSPLNMYNEAQQYLRQVCAESRSNAAKIDETIKVIQGTIELGILPNEQLICPLIRDLCQKGNPEDAEMALNHLSKRFNIEITFLSLAEIVRGFVQNQNWTRIDKIFSQLHEEGLSRRKVYGYAALVTRVLEGYQRHKSPEQIYDFLTYYIEGFGLVPTSQISLVALDGFIRAKRFDLIAKWVHERRNRFSALDAATSSVSAALKIGTAWHEIGASSEDVLHACIALARGYDRDPFSEVFRGMTAEVVYDDISRRMEALIRSCSSSDKENFTHIAFDLWGLLQEADKLLDFFKQQREVTFQQQLAIQGLLRQMKSTQRLDALFRGQIRSASIQSHESASMTVIPEDNPSHSGHIGAGTLAPDMARELGVEKLRSVPDFPYFIDQHYLRREKEGLRPDHGVLQYLARAAPFLQRELEVMSVIETIAQSRWVKGDAGVPFGIETYEAWLKLLLKTRMTKKFREVLWLVLDSDAEFKISTRFLLIVRLGALKLFDPRLRFANEAQLEEIKYLKSRLYRRAWEERGKPMVPVSRFGAWEIWK